MTTASSPSSLAEALLRSAAATSWAKKRAEAVEKATRLREERKIRDEANGAAGEESAVETSAAGACEHLQEIAHLRAGRRREQHAQRALQVGRAPRMNGPPRRHAGLRPQARAPVLIGRCQRLPFWGQSSF